MPKKSKTKSLIDAPADSPAKPLTGTRPAWKTEILEKLDKWTDVPLIQQLDEGTITENILLFLNLGLSTLMLQAKVIRFNKVIQRYSTKAKPDFISNDDLAECETVSDLLKLVESRL